MILSADDATFLQAGGEGDGPYTLEYRRAGEQFQAVIPLTKHQVERAFLDYLRGGSGWRTERQWRQLRLKRGCFEQAALLLLLGVAALWLMGR
jgi:hypothetical protein